MSSDTHGLVKLGPQAITRGTHPLHQETQPKQVDPLRDLDVDGTLVDELIVVGEPSGQPEPRVPRRVDAKLSGRDVDTDVFQSSFGRRDGAYAEGKRDEELRDEHGTEDRCCVSEVGSARELSDNEASSSLTHVWAAQRFRLYTQSLGVPRRNLRWILCRRMTL
jgi:hypothetical protein